jgi:hypothetical protein
MANKNDAKASQKNTKTKGNRDITALLQKINEDIEQYKAENPGIDVDAALSEQKELLPILGLLPNRELDRFINYAKEQGTNMSFSAMEMGVLNAGRKDMQSGLGEILDSLTFPKPACPECEEAMDNRGRSKKKRS